MLTAESLRGIWAGLPLAWDQQDELDEQRYDSDIERSLDIGAHGVYAAGSTGEFYALDFDDVRRITEIMTGVARTRNAPCQIGCTWQNTRDTMRRIVVCACSSASPRR
jgi:dihydrodipicolinate synthase/N-acetylneuraminate lyase